MAPYVTLIEEGLAPFVREHELDYIRPQVEAAHAQLRAGTGPGAEFLGWLDLPVKVAEHIEAVQQAAAEIQTRAEVLVVVGIGGSYLGARAALDALTDEFATGSVRVLFAGHNLSSTYHARLLDYLADKDFCVNVISKSGTTTEPAIAFRLLRELLEKKYGRDGARRRIYATTDAGRGALRAMAEQEGYASFVIPADIGGRYSVLTPVGLLPMAAGGLDIARLVQGAHRAMEELQVPELADNPCYRYAALRNILLRKGKLVELLAMYEPCLHTFGEWWKQLFGESEGKDGKGLFPASVVFSTDLHSLGQYIQDGARILFETVLYIKETSRQVTIPHLEDDLDQLNYLAGKSMEFVNSCAFRGTLQAHVQGGTPNIVLELPELSEYSLGYLFYFMKKACAISGYLLGVNPFIQQGVEAYKQNMFALLGKPKREQGGVVG